MGTGKECSTVVVGSEEWMEQVVLATDSTFDVNLTGLQSGAQYEYRSVLEDLSGNVLITDWESL